ncbi:MAG: thioester domain-containing protein [Oscillospiraceae bacterium]|nr:thioester domain-containing protein [Oscillospiraceae bacterium]
MKIKKVKSKLLTLMVSSVLLLSVISASLIAVSAAVFSSWRTNYPVNLDGRVADWVYTMSLDGVDAYCIQWGVNVSTGDIYQPNPTYWNEGLDNFTRNRITMASLYGFPNFNSHTNARDALGQAYYAATQVLIWEFQTGSRTTYDDYPNVNPRFYNMMWNWTDQRVRDCYFGILARARDHNAIPAFMSVSSNPAPPLHTMNWNEANKRYEITFTQGYVSTMITPTIPGVGVSHNGDTITFFTTTTNPITSPVSVTMQKNNIGVIGNAVIWGNTTRPGQPIITGRGTPDPVRGYFRLQTSSMGSLTIIKDSRHWDNDLFTFRVTGPNNYNRTVSFRKNDISTTISNLPVGRYYVEEINLDTSKYQPPTNNPRIADITNNGNTTITITNFIQTGRLGIRKTSNHPDTDTFTFRITGANNFERIINVAKDRRVEALNLPVGTYTVEEINLDTTKYQQPPAQTVRVTGGSTTNITFNNRAQTGNLRIEKTTDSSDKNEIFVFRVTGPMGFDYNIGIMSDSSFVISNLAVGDYTVEEVDLNTDKYLQPPEQTVTVKPTEITPVPFFNEQIEVEVKIDGFVRWLEYQRTGNAVYRTEFRRGERYVAFVDFTNHNSQPQTLPYTIAVDGAECDHSGTSWVTINPHETTTVMVNLYVPTNANDNINIEATVNIGNSPNEKDPDNNRFKLSGTIIKGDLYGQFITPNGPYREETEVFSTFRVFNTFPYDLTPEDDFRAEISVYYYNTAGTKVNISTTYDMMTAIPSGNNLIWAKWRTPRQNQTNNNNVYVELTIDQPNNIYEDNETNNIVTVTRPIVSNYLTSETPGVKFESTPEDFKPTNSISITDFTVNRLPTSNTTNLTWERWKWNGTGFEKEIFGAQLATSPLITPDPDIRSTEQLTESHGGVLSSGNPFWMRSGYGFLFDDTISVVSSGTTPLTAKEYTLRDMRANMYFPEFNYRHILTRFRTLEKVGNTFKFPRNRAAIDAVGLTGQQRPGDQSRIHFTQLWTPDGAYVVKRLVYDVWTPAGMMSENANIEKITIEGSLYDDWAVAEKWMR